MSIVATRGRRNRRLGIVSQEVNGALIYSSPVSGRQVTSRRLLPIGLARPVQVPISLPTPVRIGPVAQPQPIWNPSPGGSYYGNGGGYGRGNPWQGGQGSGYASNNPSSSNNLALLAEQYNSNPSSLTQQQWQQLQAAGVIPQTSPYSNASLVSTGSSAIDPATGQTYASELAAAQAAATASTSTIAASSSIIGTDPTTGATTIFGVDWYWIAAALGLVYVFTGKRR